LLEQEIILVVDRWKDYPVGHQIQSINLFQSKNSKMSTGTCPGNISYTLYKTWNEFASFDLLMFIVYAPI